MANPNLALRRMARNPFYYVKEFNESDPAETLAAELRASGKQVRVVTIRNRYQKRRTFRVMARESV